MHYCLAGDPKLETVHVPSASRGIQNGDAGPGDIPHEHPARWLGFPCVFRRPICFFPRDTQNDSDQ